MCILTQFFQEKSTHGETMMRVSWEMGQLTLSSGPEVSQHYKVCQEKAMKIK